MTDPLVEQDESSTPLSAEEREGLILSYITLRGELNEAEQANILEAGAAAHPARNASLLRRVVGARITSIPERVSRRLAPLSVRCKVGASHESRVLHFTARVRGAVSRHTA